LLKCFVKPRIKVANHIVEENGIYRLKFINLGFCRIEDVNIDMFLMKDNSPDRLGLIHYEIIDKLDLKQSRRRFIDGMIRGRIFDPKKRRSNCVQVRIKSNVEEMWSASPEAYVFFQIVARHTKSGIGTYKRVKFLDRDDTVKRNAKYEKGISMKIRQINNN
jgi:hypothetical protein